MRGVDLKQDTAIQAVKAAPAVAGTAATWLTLNEWVALATLIYIVIQAAVLLHRHYFFVQDRKKGGR